MRHGEDGNDADERLPIFLRLHRLRRLVAPDGRRLLCVLLLWDGSVPTDSTFGSRRFLLRLTDLHEVRLFLQDISPRRADPNGARLAQIVPIAVERQ